MSHIAIERSHPLTSQQARQAAETFAEHLASRHQISYRWEDDVLHFQRAGVDGQVVLVPGAIQINVRLSWLLAPFKERLEQEIHRHLDEILALSPSADTAPPAANEPQSAATPWSESHL